MTERIPKLNPSGFPAMSPLMAAAVGWVLGQSFTNAEIAQVTVCEAEIRAGQTGSKTAEPAATFIVKAGTDVVRL